MQCSDPIPTSLLKQCVEPLVNFLTPIINMSLESGEFPSCLKHALVRPLLKKSSLDPEIMKNFRPVSNLPVMSKIIEKVVAKRLTDHMNTNSLSEKFQSAYKACHSTETALIRVQNDILVSMDQHYGVVLVLLDLSAAFDTIDHDNLLHQLSERLGIRDRAQAWFSSYLSDRTQSVSIDGVSSPATTLKYGVPQGSVLGPLLYTIYTLRLGNILEDAGIQYHMFADDTQLYLTFNAKSQSALEMTVNKLQCCVESVKRWMYANKLKLNEEKTEVLVITSNQLASCTHLQSFQVESAQVTPAQSVRNIGVQFDASMSMTEHISKVCKTAYFHLRNIGAIRKMITQDAAEKLVHALITSRIDYGNALLYGIPKVQLNRLQRLLHIAARIVTQTPPSVSITPVLKSLHWLPIRHRIEYKIILTTFKTLNGCGPQYLKDLLQPYEPTRTLRSANQNFLSVPVMRLKTYGNRSFQSVAPTLWNALPDDLRKLKDKNLFKGLLKKHMFSLAFN